MDKYNKSIQHTWFHHATWGSPKYKNEGVGEVIWHSLTEDGKVEFVNIKFGSRVYENVSVKHLKPVDESQHSHGRSGKELDDKKKKKAKKESKMIKLKDLIKEGGMGILDKDQADILQGLVMKNKNKNAAAILRLVMKSGYFKGIDKKEMLGYIAGAKDFAKYMKL